MITPTTAGIALVIALIVFGPGKLPEVGKAIGKGVREFKKATQFDDDEPVPQQQQQRAAGGEPPRPIKDPFAVGNDTVPRPNAVPEERKTI